jgi:hypothetical protein
MTKLPARMPTVSLGTDVFAPTTLILLDSIFPTDVDPADLEYIYWHCCPYLIWPNLAQEQQQTSMPFRGLFADS